MSVPLKPWGSAPTLQRSVKMSGVAPQSSCPTIPGGKIQHPISGMPPPLPPRQHLNAHPSIYGAAGYSPSPLHSYSMYGGYSGYGGGYSGFGGGFTGLGGYGQSSFGYGGMPCRGRYNGRSLDDTESRFIQMAEESSRPAFQSIDSIVRTFASVTMMLESTFHAMQTSFHAVLGVAENFDRLRQLSAQVAKYVSALAMIRTIYWFYRRVLYMLGLIKNHPSSEDVWSVAERTITGSVEKDQPINVWRSSWPIVTFFGLLFGGPFVIYKLVSSIKGSDEEDAVWDPRIHESEEVVVMYKFRPASEKELNVEVGERLKIPTAKYIKDNDSGWILAVNQNNRIGLVPLNYLARLNKKMSLANVPETFSYRRCVEEGNKHLASTNRTNSDENQTCDASNGNGAVAESVTVNTVSSLNETQDTKEGS